MDYATLESCLMQLYTHTHKINAHLCPADCSTSVPDSKRTGRTQQSDTSPPPQPLPPSPPPLRLTSSHIDGAAPRMMIITFLEYRMPKRKKKTSVGMKAREERTRRLSAGGGRRVGIENTEGGEKRAEVCKGANDIQRANYVSSA